MLVAVVASRPRSCYTAPAARFSKRVNSRIKASFTTPVGPLRCLPMMSSATPCASVGGVLVGVLLLAIDEDDDVGVLLERARFAQVRELRPMIGPRLRRAAELRQHDDRHAQFLGEPLERARNRRHFERAVLEPAAPLHQLDVVDDDEVQAVLATPAAGTWRASRARRSTACRR